MQENANVKATGSKLKVPQPCIIIRGSLSKPKDAFLAAEQVVLCKIPYACMREIGLILLTSFYSFNMHYTQGLTNLFTFMKCYVFGHKVPKEKTRIGHLMAQLHQSTTIL